MLRMLQIRNVPGELHRRLKARAALAGLTLSEYLLRELQQIADRPTLDELLARLQGRQTIEPHLSPAEAVREERERE